MPRHWRFAVACALAASVSTAADPLHEAQARFSALSTYRVTLRSIAADGASQVIRYFYSRPGRVRMEFVEPRRGMVLVYDPSTRTVRIWPFGVENLVSMRLAPDNPLLRAPHGHRIDRSDVGALLANLMELRTRGAMTVLGAGELGGRRVSVLQVVGARGASVNGVNSFRVWLANDTMFPLRVESFDRRGDPIETVDMTDAEIGVDLADSVFDP